MLEFDPIRAPALAGGKQEPVAHVSYLGGPAPVLFPVVAGLDRELILTQGLSAHAFQALGHRVGGAAQFRHRLLDQSFSSDSESFRVVLFLFGLRPLVFGAFQVLFSFRK